MTPPLPTFHVADLTLTVRPLLVSVHFIRRKKLRSVFGSLDFLEPEITNTHSLKEETCSLSWHINPVCIHNCPFFFFASVLHLLYFTPACSVGSELKVLCIGNNSIKFNLLY